MASQRQMIKNIERMHKQIVEQNNTIIEMLGSRLPEKKKRGRPKKDEPVTDGVIDEDEQVEEQFETVSVK